MTDDRMKQSGGGEGRLFGGGGRRLFQNLADRKGRLFEDGAYSRGT